MEVAKVAKGSFGPFATFETAARGHFRETDRGMIATKSRQVESERGETR
jgi:hypothetical protein